jgi:hypothetical protein
MPRIVRFWDTLPRFGQPPSCKQPGMCSENSGLRQAISELVQRVKPCGMALNPASRVLRSDSVALIGSPRGVSFVLPWCSANPPILDECRQTGSYPNGVLGNANRIVPVFTAQGDVRHLAFASILLDHASRVLVLAQSDKLRMPQPVSLGPFQKFNLSDGLWPQPYLFLHFLSVEFFAKS